MPIIRTALQHYILLTFARDSSGQIVFQVEGIYQEKKTDEMQHQKLQTGTATGPGSSSCMSVYFSL